MDQFLKYFDQPVRRNELQGILGIQQANSVIRTLTVRGHIQQEAQCEPYTLTKTGREQWERYTGVRR